LTGAEKILVGSRRAAEPGDPTRGARLHPVADASGQGGPRALAAPGCAGCEQSILGRVAARACAVSRRRRHPRVRHRGEQYTVVARCSNPTVHLTPHSGQVARACSLIAATRARVRRAVRQARARHAAQQYSAVAGTLSESAVRHSRHRRGAFRRRPDGHSRTVPTTRTVRRQSKIDYSRTVWKRA
jgi:hypothetical protein